MVMGLNAKPRTPRRSTTPILHPEGALIVRESPVQCKTPAKKTPKKCKTATPATPSPRVTEIAITPPTPPTPLYPILINNERPSKSTVALRKLEKMPVLNIVTVRETRIFKKNPERMSHEEGWVGTERGKVAFKACNQCFKGCNPFTLCCIVEGLFKGSCANCHYGGNASRCSFYQDYQKAEAHLIAEHTDAPVIPGMAPANYTGGSLKQGGFTIVGSPSGALLECVPRPEEATPGVARGGGGKGPKRIAPTPAPLVGFGSTDISRRAHAEAMTESERAGAIEQFMKVLQILEEVAVEKGELDVLDTTVQSRKRKRDSEE